MFRDVLSNRAILVGIVFFLLVAGSSLLYNWHVRRETAAALARPAQMMRQIENKKEKHTSQDFGVSIGLDRMEETEMSIEIDAPQTLSEETEALLSDSISNGTTDAAPEELSPFQTEIENVIDSDFPEVPTDFPENLTPIWIEFPNYQKGDMHDHEMIYRVLIKLWNQGDHSFVNGNRVYVWETATGASITMLDKHPDAIKALALSPNRAKLATAGGDWRVRLWEVSTGNYIRSLEHPSAVNAVAFSPDGKILASAGGPSVCGTPPLANGYIRLI